MAPTSHYFDADPASPLERRQRRVSLRGREVEVTTANAVFSGGGLDKATAILLREVPSPPAQGAALDLGCGWGPIALSLALESPDLDVVAVDVNERALALTRENAERLGCTRITATTPDRVAPELEFDVIWSNPPIRIGKAALHELLGTWLPRLREGGSAWLVVAKQLGADSLQRHLADTLGAGFAVSRATTDKGFRILRIDRVIRPS